MKMGRVKEKERVDFPRGFYVTMAWIILFAGLFALFGAYTGWSLWNGIVGTGVGLFLVEKAFGIMQYVKSKR